MSHAEGSASATGGSLLDIHCHGGAGADFASGPEAARRAAAYHRATRSAVVASLVSAPAEHLLQRVADLAPLVADGTIAGIHLEGPFLAPGRRGAHDPAALCLPDVALVDRLVAHAAAAGVPEAIRHWTFAPELPGAKALIERLAGHRIVPAIGHTEADTPTVDAAIEQIVAATGRPALVTHLFNGMPPLHHRAGGPVAAALAAAARGEAVLEVIADGVHLAPEVVRLVFDLVGADAIALVSDATSASGMGDGRFVLGGLPVVVADGVARLDGSPGLGPIAGSTATLASCVAWAVTAAAVDPDAAGRAASLTPARVLGLRPLPPGRLGALAGDQPARRAARLPRHT